VNVFVVLSVYNGTMNDFGEGGVCKVGWNKGCRKQNETRAV